MLTGRRRLFLLWLFTALALPSAPAAAQVPVAPADTIGPDGLERCLDEIRGRSAGPVSCRIGYRPNAEERSNLVRLTAGTLLDADCAIDVAVGRELVVSVLLAPEVLDVPPQSASCRFETVATPLDVDFLLAPKIWFEDGRATRATPNIHGIRGLPAFLGDVLAQAINRDPQIEATMVAEVNALLDGLGRR